MFNKFWDLYERLEKKLKELKQKFHDKFFGNPVDQFELAPSIITIEDGIAIITAVPVGVGRLIHFKNPGAEILVPGLIMSSKQNRITVFILGGTDSVTINSEVLIGRVTSNSLSTGQFCMHIDLTDFFGQVVDIFGGSSSIGDCPQQFIKPNNGIADRVNVWKPLITGTKMVDCLFPIGLGQRQLIIGDRYTGKTTIAVDAIIAQWETRLKCIFVSVGQKRSSVKRLVSIFTKTNSFHFTTIVSASSADPAALQFLAPYTGCALAELFSSLGGDALIVYDDLSKHAVAYRQMALLLRKSPGRDAFPSDIFYLHSNLLERAGQFFTGSLTALPIVETLARDVSAFVPTNVISITDGQLFLDSSYFNKGILPAINIGLSVSRVGSKSQFPAMAYMSKWFTQKIVEFRNLESLLSFSSDVDSVTASKVKFGLRLSKFLCQAKTAPVSSQHQLLLFALVYKGALTQISLENVTAFSEFVIRWTSEFLFTAVVFNKLAGTSWFSFDHTWSFDLVRSNFMEDRYFLVFYFYILNLFLRYQNAQNLG